MYRGKERNSTRLLACVFIHSEWFIKQKAKETHSVEREKHWNLLKGKGGKRSKKITWKIGKHFCCCCSAARARDFNSSPHQIYLKANSRKSKNCIFIYENEERRCCKWLFVFSSSSALLSFQRKYHCCTCSGLLFASDDEFIEGNLTSSCAKPNTHNFCRAFYETTRWICVWRKVFLLFDSPLLLPSRTLMLKWTIGCFFRRAEVKQKFFPLASTTMRARRWWRKFILMKLNVFEVSFAFIRGASLKRRNVRQQTSHFSSSTFLALYENSARTFCCFK